MLPARVVKSLTGLSSNQIKKLTPIFSASWINADIKNGKHANPDRPGREMGSSMKDILTYVLAYLKTNLTFDALSAMFSVKRSTFYDLVRRGLNAIEMALDSVGAIPLRDIDSTTVLLAELRGKKDLLLDVTERPIRRPSKGQKKYYSGKKKRHTVKNQILSDENKKIIVLSSTEPGSKHDFQIFKEQELKNCLPTNVTTHVDLGYQGIESQCPDNTISIPDKKPKNMELTSTQNESNKAKSSFRVKVEHAIGGIKRMRGASDICRAINSDLRDQMMLICAGLWNYTLIP